LFEGGFEVFDDFLRENLGIGKIVGVFEALVAEREYVESRKVAPGRVLISKGFKQG